jgi:hypothetical protein
MDPNLKMIKIPLANGFSLNTDADNPGEFISLHDSDDGPLFYWDHVEWAEDPVGVIGAIFKAMNDPMEAIRHRHNLNMASDARRKAKGESDAQT